METMQIILRLVGSLSGAGGKSPVEATVKNLAARWRVPQGLDGDGCRAARQQRWTWSPYWPASAPRPVRRSTRGG